MDPAQIYKMPKPCLGRECQNACLYGGLGGHEFDSYTLMGYLLIWSNQYKWDLNLDLSDRILSTSLIT